MALPRKASTTGPGASGRQNGLPPSKSGVDERLRARVEGRTYTPEELADKMKQLEARLGVLRNRQEQYFLGTERNAPNREREVLKKEIDDLKFFVGRNTGLKFQAQSLFNRFMSYERMWLRTEKEIEEGRYRRDIFKARLHARKRSGGEERPPAPGGAHALADDGFPDIDEALDEAMLEDTDPSGPPGKPAPSKTGPAQAAVPAKPATVPPVAASAKPTTAVPAAKPAPGSPAGARPPPVPAGAPSDARLRAVYDAYMAAKKQCKESTTGLSYEQVSAQLKQQVPAILKQTNAKAIDFKVVIKDGKATLRAVAKD